MSPPARSLVGTGGAQSPGRTPTRVTVDHTVVDVTSDNRTPDFYPMSAEVAARPEIRTCSEGSR